MKVRIYYKANNMKLSHLISTTMYTEYTTIIFLKCLFNIMLEVPPRGVRQGERNKYWKEKHKTIFSDDIIMSVKDLTY